jgi:glycosyltransferase involved in cell wall biosynthesis
MEKGKDKKFTILHTEWSEGWGGQEIRILLEMREHRRQGHKVHILCPPRTKLAEEARGMGIAVIPLKIRNPWEPGPILRIKKMIRELKIDVLHTHSSVDSWAGGLAGRWARVPVLVRTRHISVRVKRPWLNRIYYLPDAIITTGEHIRRELLQTHKIPAERIVSIPTGADMGRFHPGPPDLELKKRMGLPIDSPVITLVAVLRAQKRHELVIAAAAEVIKVFPQARFIFVGDGPGRNRVEQEIKNARLKAQILMTGYREDIPAILSFTDLGIISSVAEGIPQFLFQMMAMGKPVIATAVGGIPEIVTSGVNGLLIPPEDPAALAKALVQLLGDPESARGLGEKGRRLVEREYTVEKMAEKVYRVYQEVYERKQKNLPEKRDHH